MDVPGAGSSGSPSGLALGSHGADVASHPGWLRAALLGSLALGVLAASLVLVAGATPGPLLVASLLAVALVSWASARSLGLTAARLRQETTERRQAEQRYRDLFERAPVMLVITRNRAGTALVADCNQLFLDTLGYTRAEALGRPLADFYSDESRAALLGGGYQRALAGSFVSEERQLLTRDGRLVETLLRAVPEVEADGAVSGTRAMYVDVTERKRAEEALRESEERYRLLFDAAPVGIGIAELDGRVLAANQSMCEMMGFGQEDVRTLRLEHLYVDPGARERLLAVLRESGRVRDWEVEFRRKDGAVRSTLLNVDQVELAGRRLTLATVRDVTERRRAEEALRLSEQRFRSLFEGMRDGVTLTHRSVVVDANPSMLRLLGLASRDELIGQSLLEWVAPAERPAAAEQVRRTQALETLDSWQELTFVRRDGSAVRVESTGATFRWEGRVYGLTTHRDLTARERAREALRRYAQRIEFLRETDRAILAARSSAEVSRVAVTHLRRLIPCEEANVVVFDWEAGQARLAAVTWDAGEAPPEGAVIPLASFPPEEVLRQGPLRYVEDLAVLPGGWANWENLRAHGIRSMVSLPLFDGGSLIGQLNLLAARPTAFTPEHLEIAREVADQLQVAVQQASLREQLQRHAAELERRVADRTAELEAANRGLKTANAELDAFAYSVSHDLRAPLRAMQGFADILLEDYADQLDAEGQDSARRIVAAAQRMDTLIQDLLAFSRISRAELQLRPVALELVVRDALVQLEAELEQRGARVAVEGSLPPVRGHRPTLVQAVANLLTNAVKFVGPGVCPEARVWAEERGEWVRLWVEDNGIGIAPEHQARIFGVFQRLHPAERYPGTGIGLAIVRRALERMGGRVGVESAEGQGSRFWLELPIPE